MLRTFLVLAMLSMPGFVRAAMPISSPWMANATFATAHACGGSYYHENLHGGEPGVQPSEYAIDFNLLNCAQDLGYPIVAVADGTVVTAAWTGPGFGYLLKIDHGVFNGKSIVSLYAHCDVSRPFAVRDGEAVKRGQVVGFVGGSGGNYSPHLHFELRENGWSVPITSMDGYDFCDNPSCNSHLQTSQNSGIFDRAHSEWGWLFGARNGGIHWYHTYNPAANFHQSSPTAPANCYVQDYFNGQTYGHIVYDALGGAREAYPVRMGFFTTWTGSGGPSSNLGMPLGPEYAQGPDESRQDFMLGYLYYKSGQGITVHQYALCSPGWTEYGWNPEVSYRIADLYYEYGARNTFGEATGFAYRNASDGVWYQYFTNGYIDLPPDGTGGGDIAADLIGIVTTQGCEQKLETWIQASPTLQYTWSGDPGWWSATPPSTCYDAGSVRHAVAIDMNGDNADDLITCYDYGSGQTRFHRFLQDPLLETFTYGGDLGAWYAGPPWGSYYDANAVRHLIPAHLNDDNVPDLIAAYNYGNGETHFHRFLLDPASLTYAYGGDLGAWYAGPPWGSNYDLTRVKFLVPANVNGDNRTDLIAAYDYGNGETHFHRFVLDPASMTYAYGGDLGSWYAGPPWGSNYDLTRVKFLVPANVNGDDRTDLIAAYDYGNGETHFHRFLLDPASMTYAYGGDLGAWYAGPPWGTTYYLSQTRALVPVDANEDGYTDLVAAYDYGTELRLHLFLLDPASMTYAYQGDQGVWAASFNPQTLKFLVSAYQPWLPAGAAGKAAPPAEPDPEPFNPLPDPTGATPEITLSLQPNPASHALTLTLPVCMEPQTIRLFDLSGREALTSLLHPGASTLTLDVSKLGTGIYFVRLTGPVAGRTTQKLVVLR